MNSLFFVMNMISNIKTIKQDYHYNEQHHKKPKQLLYIQKKGYNFPVKLCKVINFILIRVHTKVIDLVIYYIVLLNLQGCNEEGGVTGKSLQWDESQIY